VIVGRENDDNGLLPVGTAGGAIRHRQ
jgi:hypothetical protein